MGMTRQMKKNIKDKLQKIDKDHYSLLVDIGKVSKDQGLKSYLVGGMVRDLLLGFDNLDIDIVIENNAKQLADALVKKLPNCELAAKHDRFHTAKVIFNINGKKIPIDLASTREEIYEHSAALPTVKISDLKKDLYRRDFTINALAVSILPEDFGEIVDLFDGLIDLKEKKIRVLHEGSFIDDPTRMIRAVRFACKPGFTIEENTQRFLKEAIESKQFDNLIEKIRGDRVKIEIRYLFNLPDIGNTIKAFFESGIYRMVSTSLRAEQERRPTGASVRAWQSPNVNEIASLQQVTPRNDISAWLIYLALIMKDLNSDNREKIMKDLQLSGDEIKIIKDGFNTLNKLKEKKLVDSIIIYRELKNLSIESICIVKMLCVIARRFEEPTKQSQERETVGEIASSGLCLPRNDVNELTSLIDEYLNKTSKIKLEITGQDLINMGVKEGKKIGEVLEKILEMKIKNPDMSKQNELVEAKKLI